jgi:hypothetical protein
MIILHRSHTKITLDVANLHLHETLVFYHDEWMDRCMSGWMDMGGWVVGWMDG